MFLQSAAWDSVVTLRDQAGKRPFQDRGADLLFSHFFLIIPGDPFPAGWSLFESSVPSNPQAQTLQSSLFLCCCGGGWCHAWLTWKDYKWVSVQFKQNVARCSLLTQEAGCSVSGGENCVRMLLTVPASTALVWYRYVGELIFYLAQKVKVDTVYLMLLFLPESSPQMCPLTTFVLYTIEWWSLYGHIMKHTDSFVIVCLFKRCKTNQDPVLGDHGRHKCAYTTGMSLIYRGSETVNGQSATCSDVPTGHVKWK